MLHAAPLHQPLSSRLGVPIDVDAEREDLAVRHELPPRLLHAVAAVERGVLARGRVVPHVVDPYQIERDPRLRPHPDDAVQQDEVAEGGLPVEAGVVDPEGSEALAEEPSQRVGPGAAVGEVEALGGAPADAHDREERIRIGGRLLAADTERVGGVDDLPIELVVGCVVDLVALANGELYGVSLHAQFEGVVHTQYELSRRQRQQHTEQGERSVLEQRHEPASRAHRGCARRSCR
jgi:hypothetical protein